MPRLDQDLVVRSLNACWGRAAPMTTRFKTEQEYEVQIRNLLRLVSICTLGLWSFAAGLLIGSFYLF